jgi:hypothetical protein
LAKARNCDPPLFVLSIEGLGGTCWIEPMKQGAARRATLAAVRVQGDLTLALAQKVPGAHGG